MLKTGTWIGYYQYNNVKMEQRRGVEQTGFTIEILTISNDEFTGTVTDDLATGGMNGVGTITGKIIANGITFVKQMPKMLLIHPDGHHEERTEAHQPLYYTGVFEDDGRTVSGEWTFKTSFFLKIFLYIIGMSGANSGTWSMRMSEDKIDNL
jgi:hypothetical protein